MNNPSIPKKNVPPVMIDHRLWRNAGRLDRALRGIFELRALQDNTLSGFSRWTDDAGTWCVHVLFNHRQQLLSAQVVGEDVVDSLISRGDLVWRNSEVEHQVLSVDSIRQTVFQQLGGTG
jgi:hypothetical protein